MGTLTIKYPVLKGFLTSFYTFDYVSVSFLNPTVGTNFFSYGYNLNLNLILLPFN